MRLIEFLTSPAPAATEETYRYVRIPLEYLGGSYKDYRTYRVGKFFENMNLTERAADRYSEMMTVFKTLDDMKNALHPERANTARVSTVYKTMLDTVQAAMIRYKRQDRIVWALRFHKAKLLNPVYWEEPNGSPEQKSFNAVVTREHDKAIAKLNSLLQDSISKYGDSKSIYHIIDEVTSNTFIMQIEHFLSLDLPEINQIVWNNQAPFELIDAFHAIETKWMANRDQTIDTSGDADAENFEVIEQFPDGSAWFNLNRSSCSREGNAMGHCGNTAANRSYETVLSYRVPVDARGRFLKPGQEHNGTHWHPRMTFILNKKTGMLGEMKGRANKKPKDELLPYIVALLRNPLVKGITGGGYAAHENFSMDDLPEDTRMALIKEKPGLGTLNDQYKIEGLTDEVISRLEGALDGADLTYAYTDRERKEVVIFVYEGLTALIDYITPTKHSLARTVSNYISGNDSPDSDGHYSGDLSDRQELARDMFAKEPEMWSHLQAYVRETYPDQLGIKDEDDDEDEDEDYDPDYDIDDVNSVISLLKDEDDEIYDAIGYAIQDGHAAGAEDEMHEAFWKWLEDPFGGEGITLRLDDGDKWDGTYSIRMSMSTIFDGMDNDPDFLDGISSNYWSDYFETKELEEPRYGWNGYDDEVALERALDIELPEVDSYEVELAGDSTISDLNSLKAKIKEFYKAEETTISGGRGKVISTDEINFADMKIVNGTLTMGVFVIKSDNYRKTFAQALRYLAEWADEIGEPLVIRGYNKASMSDLVGEAGFKLVKHDYLRYDPPKPVEESTDDDGPIKIKLRGFGARDDAGDPEGFLEDFYDMTSPHPFDRGRLYGTVSIEVSKWGSDIHLGNIASLGDKQSGHGTAALQMLMALADKHGVKLSGTAKAYSKNPEHVQSSKRLAQWYKKNGFKILGGYPEDGYEIEYTPKATS